MNELIIDFGQAKIIKTRTISWDYFDISLGMTEEECDKLLKELINLV